MSPTSTVRRHQRSPHFSLTNISVTVQPWIQVFWVISVQFDLRNTLPKSGSFLLLHPVYAYFNVFFKLIKVHLLVSELYIYQNARCNDKKKTLWLLKCQGDAINTYSTGGEEVQLRSLLTSEMDGGEWPNFTTRPLYHPGRKTGDF